MLKRLCFDYANSNVAKIRLYPDTNATFPLNIRITSATWWINDKYDKTLLDKYNNIAYIGDSWGEYYNRATSRELSRLTGKTVVDYSKGGHTCKYAQAWFDEYIIKNKHDCVIIEYFTNDFNSISDVNWSLECNTPSGESIQMKLNSLNEYKTIMNELIEKSIENGIQPIVILPHSTNSGSQAQAFGRYTIDIFEGVSVLNEDINVNTLASNSVTTSIIKGKETGVNKPLKILTTEVSSSVHQGIVIDTDQNITGGSLIEFNNNGNKKASINSFGAFVGDSIILPRQQYSVPINSFNRGRLFIANHLGGDDLRIVIQLSDGSYVQKRIVLEDIT